MDGRIFIDGMIEDGLPAIEIRGDGPADPKALCTLVMPIDRNLETKWILELMLNHVTRRIQEDEGQFVKTRINEEFDHAGIPGLSDDALNLLGIIFRDMKPVMTDA